MFVRKFHSFNHFGKRFYTSITQHEKFLFDLNGFLIVRNVLSGVDVDNINNIIDDHGKDFQHRQEESVRNTAQESPLRNSNARSDCGNVLSWQKPDCLPFRQLLAHAKLVPYLNTFCGQGYRLDHLPLLISQPPQSEGFRLHGGPLYESGLLNPFLQYKQCGPTVWNTLINMSVVLTPHQNTGGLVLLRGSHKSGFPVPEDLAEGFTDDFLEHVYQPVTQPGDVIFFSEATTHGALPWTANHERRVILYRFSPPNIAYSRSYESESFNNVRNDSTENEKAVLTKPYHTRVDRALLDVENGNVVVKTETRALEKKDFDKKVFQANYF